MPFRPAKALAAATMLLGLPAFAEDTGLSRRLERLLLAPCPYHQPT